MKNTRLFARAAFFIGSFWIFFAATGCSAAATDHLLLLHTNDIHSHQDAFDNFRAGKHHYETGGAARRAALIGKLRAEGLPTLLLDAGDVFQGTPYFNFYQGRLDYDLMTMMHYDLGCLGNHDLDRGYHHWAIVRTNAHFPILSANVMVPGLDGKPTLLCTPDTLLTWGGHKVGFFGLTTEDVPTIVNPRMITGLTMRKNADAARECVARLRSQGAEMVVAITHIGVSEDKKLAGEVAGIDLIVSGHSHTFLDSLVMVPRADAHNGWGGTGIVQTGCYGINLGRLDVEFDGTLPKSVRYQLIPIDSSITPDPAVNAWLRPFHAGVDSAMSPVVGEALGNFSKDEGAHSETALGNLVSDVLQEASGSQIGLQNWGGIRASIPKGPIKVGDIYTMLPFDNDVMKLEVKGSTLKELFDFVAKTNLERGRGAVAGASFVQTRQGADSILVGGQPLDLARTYTLGTTDFLYNGGDGFKMLEQATKAERMGVFLRDVMITYLQKHGTVTPKLEGRMRIARP